MIKLTTATSPVLASSKVPAGDYTGILKGAGFRAWIEKNRAFHMAQHDAKLDAATHLQKAIEKKGRWYLGNLDAKLAARRITKPLRHSAYLDEEAARALSSSLALYSGYFAPQAQKPTDFDPHG